MYLIICRVLVDKMAATFYRSNTDVVLSQIGEKECIDAAITYCQAKKPGLSITANNVVKILRDEVLKQKGFPNISAATVDNLTKLLNQSKSNPTQTKGKGKKAHTVGPGNYEYQDVLRYEIFDALRSWRI